MRVTTLSQQSFEAVAFVVPPEHHPLITRIPWDRETFVARHLADFLPYCVDFHASQVRRLGLAVGPR